MLLDLGDGKSPVAGRGSFKKLNKEYAGEQKDGNTTANMELEGDMLDALLSKNRKGDKIEIGIFKAKEQGKADGHNNFSGKSTLPTRRFIPNEKERFKKRIRTGIKTIINDNKVIRQFDGDTDILGPGENIAELDLDSILGRSFFDEFGVQG